LYAPVDGDVVDVDAAFGEELFDIAIRQAVAQVPPNGQQDHPGGNRNPTNDGDSRRQRSTGGTLRAVPNRSTQQCPAGTEVLVLPGLYRAGAESVHHTATIRGGIRCLGTDEICPVTETEEER
jgi:hypothetical protein